MNIGQNLTAERSEEEGDKQNQINLVSNVAKLWPYFFNFIKDSYNRFILKGCFFCFVSKE